MFERISLGWRKVGFGDPTLRAARRARREDIRYRKFEAKLDDLWNKYQQFVKTGNLDYIEQSFEKAVADMKKMTKEIVDAIINEVSLEALKVERLGRVVDHILRKKQAERAEHADRAAAIDEEVKTLKESVDYVLKLFEHELNEEINALDRLSRGEITFQGIFGKLGRLDEGSLMNKMVTDARAQRSELRRLRRLEKKLPNEMDLPPEKKAEVEQFIKSLATEEEQAEKLEIAEMNDLLLEVVYFFEKINKDVSQTEGLGKEQFPKKLNEEMLKDLADVKAVIEARMQHALKTARIALGEEIRAKLEVNT